MNIREKLRKLYDAIDRKFMEQFSFRMTEITFLKLVEYLHVPKDASSLAVTRILFGLAMLFDIADERGGATMARRWGGAACHFPLLPFILPLPMPYMAIVYAALWIGAIGIVLGYKYRITSTMFTVCYWYLFLIEKSFWNNHSYLFGLVGLLLSCTQANCYLSLDAYLDPANKKDTVPYWNYFVLKYQIFILYFMAGMKKGTAEWLTGYSVQKLGEHWVFDPFKLFLSVSLIDYLIVHWFIFMFDLTVAIWMMWKRTRHIAMVFCTLFHLMNSRLFRIGMFPWVCLATMPLFYPFDWPKTIFKPAKNLCQKIADVTSEFLKLFRISQICNCNVIGEGSNEDDIIIDDELPNRPTAVKDDVEYMEQKTENEINQEGYNPIDGSNEQANSDDVNKKEMYDIPHKVAKNKNDMFENVKSLNVERSCDVTKSKKRTTYFILMYMLTQAFLPYSHFITKGFNNWTNGLYGYSWDMMVHTWDTQSVIIKIVDNENKQEYYIDPSHYTLNDRWTKHGDMVYQYAYCLKKNLLKEREKIDGPGISDNISIYADIWCSINGRFTQRLFDPKTDLLQVTWSPFSKVQFLMPLLDEAIHWRSTLQGIMDDVHSWSNASDVIFFAEFPNYSQEKYIPVELSNVTLTVLEGTILYEPEVTGFRNGQSYRLTSGNQTDIQSGLFHKIINIGQAPAYYMYTFMNTTEVNTYLDKTLKPKLPIMYELFLRFGNMLKFINFTIKSLYLILFGCTEC